MKYIDLTHTFTVDMPSYPGDPRASLKQVAFIDADTYNDYKISTVMHVGTHMDAPLHMIANAESIDDLDVDKFFGKGILIDVRGKTQIDSSAIKSGIEKDSIVILYSGFGEKFRTADYFKNYPEVKVDFAKRMVDAEVKMVGMDFLGPDYDKPWIVHKILLGSGILILENLTNLNQLIDKKFEIIALPAKFHADAAPVRAIAKLL